jgi:hypothetical protein
MGGNPDENCCDELVGERPGQSTSVLYRKIKRRISKPVNTDG